MYSSLDRVDIVARTKDGARLYIQTDHRTSAEIEQERDLSVVFLIARLINAIRMAKAESNKYQIIYSCQYNPPEFFQQIIASTGAILKTKDENELPFKGTLCDVEYILNGALYAIAIQRAQFLKENFTINAMHKYEKMVSTMKIDPEEDEVVYWTTVIQIGAFAGEILRRTLGGKWTFDDEMGPLPFVFDCRGAKVNFMGKATKFLEMGEEDSIAYLLLVALKKFR